MSETAGPKLPGNMAAVAIIHWLLAFTAFVASFMAFRGGEKALKQELVLKKDLSSEECNELIREKRTQNITIAALPFGLSIAFGLAAFGLTTRKGWGRLLAAGLAIPAFALSVMGILARQPVFTITTDFLGIVGIVMWIYFLAVVCHKTQPPELPEPQLDGKHNSQSP